LADGTLLLPRKIIFESSFFELQKNMFVFLTVHNKKMKKLAQKHGRKKDSHKRNGACNKYKVASIK
jgi:hypothetical protein